MINNAYVNKLKLNRIVNRFKYIAIYGAGYYGKYVKRMLDTIDLHGRSVFFVVSSEVKDREYLGCSVYSISELDYPDSDILFFVAVDASKSIDIVNNIINHNYSHFTHYCDYLNTFERIWCINEYDRFIECVNEWVLNSSENYTNIEQIIKNRPRQNTNQIVIITNNLFAPTERVIKALLCESFEIIIIPNKRLKNNSVCNRIIEDLKKKELKIDYYGTVEEVFYKMIQYNPLLYYIEPPNYDCRLEEILVRFKTKIGKIIVAPSDHVNGCYSLIGNPHRDELFYAERNMLENADGIVWRWQIKEYYEKELGFNFKGKSIQWYDYCNNEEKIVKESIIENNNILKICYPTGGVSCEVDYPLIGCAKIQDLLEKALKSDKDILFHIYCSNMSDESFRICTELKEKYNFFDFFIGLTGYEYKKALEEYDYGINPSKCYTGIEPGDLIHNNYYSSHILYASSNRYYDLIDAGIPIITTISDKQTEFLLKYDVIIKRNVEDIDFDYLFDNRDYYKKRTIEAKKELSVYNHIEDMICFMKEVVG